MKDSKKTDDLIARHLKEHMNALTPVFARAKQGDFSEPLSVPDDEFKGLYQGINLLLLEAKRRMADLSQSRAKDEAVLRNIGEGLFVTDKDGRIQLINPRACALLGIRKQDVVGKEYSGIAELEDEKGRAVSPEERPINLALQTGEVQSIHPGEEYFYYRSLITGKRFPVMLTVSPFMIEGKIAGAVSVFRDSTHERNMSRAKSEFISLASHQLRTPIAIMSLNLEILERSHGKELPDGPVREHISEVGLALKRMLKLVNTLLNVSRIELGTLQIDRKPVEVDKVVSDSVRDHTPLARERSLSINTTFGRTLPPIDSDPSTLRIVLDNLLSNAIKYSFPETTLDIHARKKGAYVVIEIRNRGYGIPEDQYGQVFTKMFRADNITRTGEEGTGLGLYVAHSITAKLGGKIWFESIQNEETTFFVELPILRKQSNG